MIGLLIGLVVFAIVFYIVFLIVNFLIEQLSLPPVIKQVALLIMGLIGLLYLLNYFGLYSVPLR